MALDTHSYGTTRARVADYFDGSATRVWERLTSDAPVSKIRQTVRAGRDQMRTMMLSRLPRDLSGMRVLDAGCGTGAGSVALAMRGAEVLGIDISPKLVEIADKRLPVALRSKVSFKAGDMLTAENGSFDAVIAMDSLIYYTKPDLIDALAKLSVISRQVVFTVAPRTPLLMGMWYAGKVFPKSDRSPIMIPHNHRTMRLDGLRKVGRVSKGFYISECLELLR